MVIDIRHFFLHFFFFSWFIFQIYKTFYIAVAKSSLLIWMDRNTKKCLYRWCISIFYPTTQDIIGTIGVTSYPFILFFLSKAISFRDGNQQGLILYEYFVWPPTGSTQQLKIQLSMICHHASHNKVDISGNYYYLTSHQEHQSGNKMLFKIIRHCRKIMLL